MVKVNFFRTIQINQSPETKGEAFIFLKMAESQ